MADLRMIEYVDASDVATNELIPSPDWALHVGEPDPARTETPAAERSDPNGFDAINTSVDTTMDHLRNNRTTVRQAEKLRDAAERSISDHATARSIR